MLPSSAGCGGLLWTTDPLVEQGSNQKIGDKPCAFPFHRFASHSPPPLLSSNMYADITHMMPLSLSFISNKTDKGKKLLSGRSLVTRQMFIWKQNKNNIPVYISRFTFFVIVRWSFVSWNTITKKYVGTLSCNANCEWLSAQEHFGTWIGNCCYRGR